jgi:hypothetical protein
MSAIQGEALQMSGVLICLFAAIGVVASLVALYRVLGWVGRELLKGHRWFFGRVHERRFGAYLFSANGGWCVRVHLGKREFWWVKS